MPWLLRSCVPWHIHLVDSPYWSHQTYTHSTLFRSCVPWLLHFVHNPYWSHQTYAHVCAMTPSFTCAMTLSYVCAMTHLSDRHLTDLLTRTHVCVPWLLYSRVPSLIHMCVPWLIQFVDTPIWSYRKYTNVCAMTPSFASATNLLYACHDTFTLCTTRTYLIKRLTHMCVPWFLYSEVPWLIHMCAITHSLHEHLLLMYSHTHLYACQKSFIHVHQSCVCHDSFASWTLFTDLNYF